MLGWLPSVIKMTEEDYVFIHIHKTDNKFFDKIKELYTEVIDYYKESVKAIWQLLDQLEIDSDCKVQ